jgi:hypothetical protein
MNIVMVPLISQPRSIALADSDATGKKIEALPTGSQATKKGLAGE